MQMDKTVLYPRPDYGDGDLISKEMAGNTFASGLMADLGNFKAPMERYNVTDTKLIDMSLIKGDIKPSSYDISLQDYNLDALKELAWLPAKRSVDKAEPLIVYNPLDYYSFVEWVGINSSELFDIYSSKEITYAISNIYHDDENAGLFGFQKIVDVEDNIISKRCVFFSLKTNTLSSLASLPQAYFYLESKFVGYTKDAYILRYSNGDYLSFTLRGEIFILKAFSQFYTCLGDDSVIAIENKAGDKTHFFDTSLVEINVIADRFCVRSGGFASSPTKYLFGTKIGNAYYFMRDNTSSYKFRHSSEGWKAIVLENRAWTYLKRTKYDYVTNNWLQTPLKSLKYNLIKQGLFVRDTFPPHQKSDTIRFLNSDMYGDFVRVDATNGDREYYQTFNFREWIKLTGDAKIYLYGCMGRVWLKDRFDGVSGLMPYTIVVKSVNDFIGGKKTVLQFSGFIFRGGIE